ncbi:unnamed protein product [Haemonchus placei]|uniref:ZP domain-containing protein n=1 Tax=Haemonchus placei TaxID=6290 RepID=A0A0N4X9V5_HAEPC|nr:unnamed protein product [Haemonchus placei]
MFAERAIDLFGSMQYQVDPSQHSSGLCEVQLGDAPMSAHLAQIRMGDRGPRTCDGKGVWAERAVDGIVLSCLSVYVLSMFVHATSLWVSVRVCPRRSLCTCLSASLSVRPCPPVCPYPSVHAHLCVLPVPVLPSRYLSIRLSQFVFMCPCLPSFLSVCSQ